MPFLTPTPRTPSYNVTFVGPVALWGVLNLRFEGDDDPAADGHVQDLINRLAEALEGSPWSVSGSKVLNGVQSITPDETPEA